MAAGPTAVDPGATGTVLDDTLELLARLVAHETTEARSNLDLVDTAEEVLVAAGATCVRSGDPASGKANLFATIGPAVDGGVVLSGHTDVVPAEDRHNWTTPPFTLVRAGHEDGDRVVGRGTADMKGFIAACLAMARVFAAADLQRPVHLALTYDEEVGCRGAPWLLDDLSRTGPRPAAAIVGEPTSMRVITAHKGCHEYTTTITGRPGHGSTPDRSVNAIWHAARYVVGLHGLAEGLRERAPADSPFDPPWSTLSIGTIQGGQARNIIAGACALDWEFRPVNDADAAWVAAEVAAMEAELGAQLVALDPDAGVVRTTDGEVRGLDTPSDSPAVALVRRLLDTPRMDVVSYNTEAGLFDAAGIPAVVCGPGSINVAHRPDEFVTLDQLGACLDLLGRLVTDLSEPR